MRFPENIKYTKEHEWISVDGKIGTIGITDYAQGELGDVVFVDLNENIGDVSAGQSLGTIEAVKTVSDLYSPAAGKVIQVNQELKNSPELLNSDPYGLGWMVKIELSNASEIDGLLDALAYRTLIGQYPPAV
ncbi:MAG: glycine cleavage system protein GcvH [Ignavibacteriales bacterium]|nr:MAG: glycine cleavage system protein GcvH [Ignavibacteriales bacterium]